jgi:hypothetical protein
MATTMLDQVIIDSPLNARLVSLLKIVPRDLRNIPLHSSIVPPCWNATAITTISVANNRAVTSHFESTNRRHHIRMIGHNFL